MRARRASPAVLWSPRATDIIPRPAGPGESPRIEGSLRVQLRPTSTLSAFSLLRSSATEKCRYWRPRLVKISRSRFNIKSSLSGGPQVSFDLTPMRPGLPPKRGSLGHDRQACVNRGGACGGHRSGRKAESFATLGHLRQGVAHEVHPGLLKKLLLWRPDFPQFVFGGIGSTMLGEKDRRQPELFVAGSLRELLPDEQILDHRAAR
jgi:hypothetical protein